MFKYVKKTIFILGIVLFIPPNSAYAEVEETFAEIAESLAEVSKDFNTLAASSLEEAAVIDNSIKELNKAIEFVQESLEAGDPDLTLKVVTFVNKSLSDVSANVPKSYKSDMSNADMSSLGEEMLAEVTNVTTALAEKKEKDIAKMMTTMLDVNDAGFNTFEISKNLNSFGVDTIKVDFEVKTRDEMSAWSKEEWQAAWTGKVLTDDGKQIITDRETQQRLDVLNAQLGLVDEKNRIIEEKNNLMQETQKELNELGDQLNDLEKQKKEGNDWLGQAQKTMTEQNLWSNQDVLSKYNKKYYEVLNVQSKIEKLQSRKPLLNVKTMSLVNELKELNNEVEELEKAKPVYEKQIAKLEDEIEKLNNAKAQLAMAQGKSIGLIPNNKVVQSIPKTEKTSIIAIKGTSIVRVVDNSMLTDQAESFEDPMNEFSINKNIYQAAAVNPEKLFAVETAQGDIQMALSNDTVAVLNSFGKGGEINIDVTATQTDLLNKQAQAEKEWRKNQTKKEALVAKGQAASGMTQEQFDLTVENNTKYINQLESELRQAESATRALGSKETVLDKALSAKSAAYARIDEAQKQVDLATSAGAREVAKRELMNAQNNALLANVAAAQANLRTAVSAVEDGERRADLKAAQEAAEKLMTRGGVAGTSKLEMEIRMAASEAHYASGLTGPSQIEIDSLMKQSAAASYVQSSIATAAARDAAETVAAQVAATAGAAQAALSAAQAAASSAAGTAASSAAAVAQAQAEAYASGTGFAEGMKDASAAAQAASEQAAAAASEAASQAAQVAAQVAAGVAAEAAAGAAALASAVAAQAAADAAVVAAEAHMNAQVMAAKHGEATIALREKQAEAAAAAAAVDALK